MCGCNHNTVGVWASGKREEDGSGKISLIKVGTCTLTAVCPEAGLSGFIL